MQSRPGKQTIAQYLKKYVAQYLKNLRQTEKHFCSKVV